MTPKKSTRAGSAALVAFVLFGAGCATSKTAPPATTQSRLGSTTTSGSDLDTFHEPDLSFFSQLRSSADIVRPPASLDEATRKSTAVVLADVVAVAPTRMVADVQMLGITLRPVEILSGALRTDPDSPLVVEMIGSAAASNAGNLADLNASLPRGRSVWFLRWQGEPPETTKPGAPKDSPHDPRMYFRLSLVGVFVQGPSGVVSALADGPDSERLTFQGHGEGFATMSSLVSYIRTVKR